MGRPSDYTPEIGEKICEAIVSGKSIRKICKADDMPGARTVYAWLVSNDAFQQQYARCREIQAELLADEIVEIADDGSNDTYVVEHDNGPDEIRTNTDVIQRSRLRVDARKWVASKLLPKKYGDKIQQEVTGEGGGPVVFTLKKIGS